MTRYLGNIVQGDKLADVLCMLFYNVFDIAALNAWVFFKESPDTSISRREFILSLVEELKIGR